MFPKETQPRFIKPCHRAKRIKYFFKTATNPKTEIQGKETTYERSVKFLQEMCYVKMDVNKGKKQLKYLVI